MSTALFDTACTIPSRIKELLLLIQLAEDKQKNNDDHSFNSLCRACSVLLVSHLEGFLKDLSKSISADLNFHLANFNSMPEAMKRNFCRNIVFYEGVSEKDLNNRITQLISFFSNNSVNIDLNAFTYKENKNKNPSPDIINATLEKLGIPSVISAMQNSILENIFKNDHRATLIIRRDLRRFRSYTYKYPYRTLPNPYLFNFTTTKTKAGGTKESLWHTFIEEIMQRRHRIVHGDTIDNDVDTIVLAQDIEKLDVLMHGILFASTSFLTNRNNSL